MFRSLALGGVAVAALSSGCCWRPFCGGGPALYNPPPAPLFPRLWAHPVAAPAPAAAPVGLPGPAGPDCPGCAAGGLPPGAVPAGALPPGAIPAGGYPVAGPVTVAPPPGALSAGPQFSPMYFGQAPATTIAPGSTQLPPPRAGDPPSAMPTTK